MQLFLLTFGLLALAFAGIAIKIWAKKEGSFSGTCASQSPFLNKEYIKFAFSFKLEHFLNFNLKKKNFNANMGKSQLKKMLAKHTSFDHAYDKKIGFHAPVSKMINEKRIFKNLNQIFDFDKLEKLIDVDKLILNLNLIKKKNLKNYNLYSLIGLQNMLG